MMNYKPLLLLLASLLLTACDNSNDPMKALCSAKPSSAFNDKFWALEQHKNTPLWQKASAFCSHSTECGHTPACASIAATGFFGNSDTSWPGYRDKGFGPDNLPGGEQPTAATRR